MWSQTCNFFWWYLRTKLWSILTLVYWLVLLHCNMEVIWLFQKFTSSEGYRVKINPRVFKSKIIKSAPCCSMQISCLIMCQQHRSRCWSCCCCLNRGRWGNGQMVITRGKRVDSHHQKIDRGKMWRGRSRLFFIWRRWE